MGIKKKKKDMFGTQIRKKHHNFTSEHHRAMKDSISIHLQVDGPGGIN